MSDFTIEQEARNLVTPDPLDYIYHAPGGDKTGYVNITPLSAKARTQASALSRPPSSPPVSPLNLIQPALAALIAKPDAQGPVEVVITLTENQVLPPYPPPSWHDPQKGKAEADAEQGDGAGENRAVDYAVRAPASREASSYDSESKGPDWLADVYALRADDYNKLSKQWRWLGDVQVQGGYGIIRAVQAKLAPRLVPALLKLSPDIQYVELQRAGELPPNGPDIPAPDNIADPDATDDASTRIRLDWLRTQGLTTGRIALLDTGVEQPDPQNQPELASVLNHVAGRYQCVGLAPTQSCVLGAIEDLGAHGTRTAAVLTADTRDTDYAGITTLPVDSFTVYGLDADGSAELDADAAVRAFETIIAANGIYSVIVAPLQGKRLAHSAISAAADRAFDAGLVVIAANGNTRFTPRSVVGEDQPWWTTSPGNAHKVIGVGAFDITGGTDASAQSYGTDDGRIKPDIQGPTAYRTLPPPNPGPGARPLRETSGATPIVGGAAALLRAWLATRNPPSYDAGHVYAHLILAGQNIEFWNNYTRDGAGELRFPTDGPRWWGKVQVAEGETVTLTLDPGIEIDQLDAACWWAEPAILGLETPPVHPYPNQIILTLVAPDGTQVEGGWPSSVFQRVRLPAPETPGLWRLRIEGAAVPTDPPQLVYWAAYGQPTSVAPSSTQGSRAMTSHSNPVVPSESTSAPTSANLPSGTNPAGLAPTWVTTVEGTRRRMGHALYLQGYVGRADTPDHFRLYRDPSLRHYLDIPNNKLLHGIKEQSEMAPLELAHIWIEADAAVIIGEAHTTAAYLLNGPISSEYGGDSAAWTTSGGRPRGGGGASFVPGCAPSSGCGSPNCPG